MKVENFDPIQQKSSCQENFHSDVIQRMFAICKTDPSFHLKENIEIVEEKEKILTKKLDKQDELLEKSKQIKKDMLNRIAIVETKSADLKNELLEKLGVEL